MAVKFTTMSTKSSLTNAPFQLHETRTCRSPPSMREHTAATYNITPFKPETILSLMPVVDWQGTVTMGRMCWTCA
jgi:hypothetical protein